MSREEVQRRLAAILVTDVASYSRLMEADEEGTLARLKALRHEVIEPALAEHHGRLVKLTGDGALVEFTSAVEAVKCAVSMQAALTGRMRDEPPDSRLAFRVGINIGDVIIDGEDVYGDGVNVAARLEHLAKPGTVLIAGCVFDQVAGRVAYGFDPLGEHRLKNIERPVRVYRVEFDAPAQRHGPPVSEKASIAVLPLTNMSGDPDQEYFADGITDEIITELSRYPDLLVIARNSTFTYKGRAVKVPEVAKELGVRYVTEGSVRKAGDRVRVTIQLIDAESGAHLWAERYDRKFVDIFELQEEITRAVVAVLPARLESALTERLKRKPPSDMAAYDCLLAGKIHHHRLTKEDNAKARELLDRATTLEPDFASAWAWKACTIGQAVEHGWLDEATGMPAAIDALNRAMALDKDDVECHRLLCELNFMHSKLDQARLHHEQAFALNPNDPRLVAQRGELLTWLGRSEEAIPWLEKVTRLDPYGAHRRCHLLGRALFQVRRYDEAVEAYKKIQIPRYHNHADLAACYAVLGRSEEAETCTAATLRLKPNFSSAAYLRTLPYQQSADREHHREAMIKAGLPE